MPVVINICAQIALARCHEPLHYDLIPPSTLKRAKHLQQHLKIHAGNYWLQIANFLYTIPRSVWLLEAG